MLALILSPVFSSVSGVSDPPQWDYVLCGGNQELLAQGRCFTKDLPERAQTVVLVVAHRLYSVHQVVLPKVGRSKVQATLAGALEESLLDEPSKLHLALWPNVEAGLAQIKTGEPCVVMACERAWLEACVRELMAANKSIQTIVVQTQNTTADAPRWQQLMQSHQEGQSQAVNLAQFGFEPQALWLSKGQSIWNSFWQLPAYRGSRWALGVLVFAQIAGVNAWAWRARADQAHKRAEIQALLLQAFPQTPVLVDPLAQMQKGVAALRARAGTLQEQDFEMQLRKQARQAPMALSYSVGAGLKVTP